MERVTRSSRGKRLEKASREKNKRLITDMLPAAAKSSVYWLLLKKKLMVRTQPATDTGQVEEDSIFIHASIRQKHAAQ